MKNNKALTYLLLALVVGIWGYVLYTVLAKVNDEEPVVMRQASKIVAEADLRYYHWQDSLRYDSIYLSPFAGDTLLMADMAPDESNIPVQTEPAYDAMAYAPAMDIQYLGFIENEAQKQRVALLQINGKQQYMRKGEAADGITLLQISNNSIRVKTDYETLTINKQ